MFGRSLTAIALLASTVFGAVTFTSVPSGISAGQSYTLLYSATDASAPVTIALRKGDPKNLDLVGTLTTTSIGGSFTWTVPAEIVSGTDYALMITQGATDVNYFGPFSVSGGTGVATSAVVSHSASASVVVTASASGKISSIASLPTAKPTGYSNSTTTKSSLSTKISTTKLPSSSVPTASATSAPNSASTLSSPVALILGAIAAMFYLQ